jgi:hypothetical protein
MDFVALRIRVLGHLRSGPGQNWSTHRADVRRHTRAFLALWLVACSSGSNNGSGLRDLTGGTGGVGTAGTSRASGVSTGGVSTGEVSAGSISTGGVSAGSISTGGVSARGVSTGGISAGGAGGASGSKQPGTMLGTFWRVRAFSGMRPRHTTNMGRSRRTTLTQEREVVVAIHI